jgi:hypothetical protein
MQIATGRRYGPIERPLSFGQWTGPRAANNPAAGDCMRREWGIAAMVAVGTAIIIFILMPFWAARYFLWDRGA